MEIIIIGTISRTYLLSLYKAKFPFNHNGLVLPAAHAWDMPQVVHFHVTVMSKYSNAKFEFQLDKFFTFPLLTV